MRHVFDAQPPDVGQRIESRRRPAENARGHEHPGLVDLTCGEQRGMDVGPSLGEQVGEPAAPEFAKQGRGAGRVVEVVALPDLAARRGSREA